MRHIASYCAVIVYMSCDCISKIEKKKLTELLKCLGKLFFPSKKMNGGKAYELKPCKQRHIFN